MRLLAIGAINHDTNFTFYDNGIIKYHKLERTKQEKRFVLYPIIKWKKEVELLWNINVDDIDDIIFQFDPYIMLPSDLQRYISDEDGLQSLDIKVCNYLDIKKGWFVGHHYSHAKSTWMLEDISSTVQIVVDGLGDGRPWSVYKNYKLIDAGNIKRGSIGWAMRDAGKLLGIKAVHQNDIAGKLMGLQSYGKINDNFSNQLSKYTIEDANILFNPALWKVNSNYLDWIRTVHDKVGYLLVDFFKKYANKNDIISYSGGVAQNVIWNSILKKEFSNIIIPPHSSDEGISLGAIKVLCELYNISNINLKNFPFCQSDISPKNNPSDETINKIADLLAANKTVGIYFNHGEIGPRALGHRSILMSPKIKDGKQKINKIKNRENYRPFGASILSEHFETHFDGFSDKYMLYTTNFKESSHEYAAISHVDNTCRLQTVTDGIMKSILQSFYDRTGCPMILNTSLNLAGKPISGYPQNALTLFFESSMDCVVIGDKMYENKS